MANDKKEGKDIVIFRYTRKQAIEDGALIDVTKMAKEAGIKFHTAVTCGLWEKYIVPGEEDRKSGQSEDGRLWDTLWMFRNAAINFSGNILLYELYFLMNGKHELVELKAECGPDFNGTPCITIMLPDED